VPIVAGRGGGRHADLARTNQLLLTIIWLRQYPTNEVLGFLFGVSDSTASRILARLLPLLEGTGKDTMPPARPRPETPQDAGHAAGGDARTGGHHRDL